MLNGFIRHTNRVFRDDDATRWCEAKSRHVLYFGGADLHRVQLISRLYQHIAHRFERHMLSRDDKNTTVIFYLADFLFKFHRRAFDWHNLERVEELAHIHRAPDIRTSIQGLVDCLSETHIAYVLNGMYAFRFRTEESLEVQYLSRFNE